MGTFNSALEELNNKLEYCKAGEWLFALEDSEVKEYMEAKESGRYTLRTLYRALVKLGLNTTYETYRHHHHGDCKCFTTN